MKYVVLVSHGTFAPGLHSVLKMLAGGEREDVISVGLEDGMSADEFAEKFSNAISKITEDDEIILLGDIVGGSPLTNAIEQVSNKGLIGQTVIFGGMNLAMALTATLMKDGVDTDMLKDSLINEAKDAVIEARQHLSDNETGFFEGMKKYLIPSLIENTSVNLWHYAMQKPFDQKKFNDAVENRNFFTATAGNDFEVVLAELYVKNHLGGSELFLQYLDEILKEASVSNPGYARSLCSFLAWMECYDLEYEVLKRTVAI